MGRRARSIRAVVIEREEEASTSEEEMDEEAVEDSEEEADDEIEQNGDKGKHGVPHKKTGASVTGRLKMSLKKKATCKVRSICSILIKDLARKCIPCAHTVSLALVR